MRHERFWLVRASLLVAAASAAFGSNRLETYYAHRAVEDAHGVVAPWAGGQNGPCDLRIRIAAELFKRYPWVEAGAAVMPAPHLVYNTHWKIADDGTISIPPTDPWMCGDLGQRALSIIRGLVLYYRYTGDPLAYTYIPLTADYILDYCLTRPDDPWPAFPVSTPTRGMGYGRANPDVPNQLDLCAVVGKEILRAYQFLGTPRYLDSAKRWGDTIAEKCSFDPELPPWSRYVNPQHLAWSDELTSGTILILEFLDELVRLGYEGAGGKIVKARDAGRAYVTRSLLPRWTENEVWGRHYWDWENPVLCGIVPWCCEYFMDHPEAFPNWKNDVRNVLSLAFNRNCVDPGSQGDTYSGAWAIPESSSCCGTSLSYNQYTYGPAFARYASLADDAWAREIARRMLIMATYDSLENGVVRDGVGGTVVAANEWLNLAQPWPLCQALLAIGWMPEVLGAGRENHIVRATAVVTSVVYGKGRIAFSTFDAAAPCTTILRLSFRPEGAAAGAEPLAERADLAANGFVVQSLTGGDFLVTVRHDGATDVVVAGDDPQEVAGEDRIIFAGSWIARPRAGAIDGAVRVASEAGARASFAFAGNQVRLVGSVDPEGGRADVYVDGVKQLTCVDCFSPVAREQQILYYKNGLAPGAHELAIAARGEGNPIARGKNVYVDAIQCSAAAGEVDRGAGGGPTGPQRMIFGYTGRGDFVDSKGNRWRPATEFVVRAGYGVDSVAAALWTERRSIYIGNTPDPELYRYGIHGQEFWVNVTVGPGTYAVRLLFADTLTKAAMTVLINGSEALKEFDVARAAGGAFRATDRTFGGMAPRNGIIEVRLRATGGRQASLQALEIVPEPPPAPPGR